MRLAIILMLFPVMASAQFGRYPYAHARPASGSSFPSGAVSNYDFDEASGNLLDQVASDDGVLTGAGIQGDSSGIINLGHYYDGTNDYVTLGTGQAFSTGDVSVSLWVFPYELAGSDQFFVGGPAGALTLGFYASDDGVWLGLSDASQFTNTTALTLTQDAWNHVVAVYDQTANTVTFYINNVSEVESFTYSFTANNTIIGARAAGTALFNGIMDELTYFTKKLTSGEVSTLYNSGNGLAY